MLQTARSHAARGWAVFPCDGKRPITDHGFKDATIDSAQIESWWRDHPDANIGIATGAQSCIFVLDVDVKDGKVGDESLRQLVEEHGALPETLRARTGSGGVHYLFRYVEGVTNSPGALPPDIDVRARAGTSSRHHRFTPTPATRTRGRTKAPTSRTRPSG